LDTCHPDTIYVSKMWRSVVTFQSQKGSMSKTVWETLT